MKKHIQLYASDDPLKDFYDALASNNNNALKKVHIPRSEVFYARAAMERDLGVRYPLDRIEHAMYQEGMLRRSDVLNPDIKRTYND
jgi:hypothetical protein